MNVYITNSNSRPTINSSLISPSYIYVRGTLYNTKTWNEIAFGQYFVQKSHHPGLRFIPALGMGVEVVSPLVRAPSRSPTRQAHAPFYPTEIRGLPRRKKRGSFRATWVNLTTPPTSSYHRLAILLNQALFAWWGLISDHSPRRAVAVAVWLPLVLLRSLWPL